MIDSQGELPGQVQATWHGGNRALESTYVDWLVSVTLPGRRLNRSI